MNDPYMILYQILDFFADLKSKMAATALLGLT
jgi:hypothetical protein